MAQDFDNGFEGTLYRGHGLGGSLWLFNGSETCGMSLGLNVVGLHYRIDSIKEHVVHALFRVEKML